MLIWPPMHTNLQPRGRVAVARSTSDDSPDAARGRRKFLRYFPGGFSDPTYLDWERDYKWQTHERWNAVLAKREFAAEIILINKNLQV